MEAPDYSAVRDCTCFGCGAHLFRYDEAGRAATNVPFAAVVLSRRMPSDVKLKVSDGKIVDFVEYPSVCSRQCFEKAWKACAAYESKSPRDALVFEYNQELVRVMWGEWTATSTGAFSLPLMPERVT
jgi:hypothetical protein